MRASPNDTVLQEAKPILQLKRPLLPIDKYAARQRVSTKIVEKYGRLGIVQIRKYKGKTYVVDVPLSPYYPTSEGVHPAGTTGGVQTLQESHKSQIPREMVSQATGKHRQPVDKSSQVKKIPELDQKSTRGTRKIAAQPIRPNIEPSKAETMSILAKSLFREVFKTKNQFVAKIRHKVSHSESTSNPAQIPKNSRRQFDIYAEQARTQRAWQVAAVSLIGCLFAAFLACLWLYMNQKVHRGRLDQTYASIQNVYDDFVRTSQHLATLQSKLVESTAELEWVKNELNNTKAGSESMRSELTQVKQGLERVQQYNTAALGQLREQLQQLTTQLGKFINNSQTLSDSSGPGK